LKLDRRINVLLYLNEGWQSDWGGQLELHSNDDLTSANHQVRTIEPILNRIVIFNTPNALHGHRRPIACPVAQAGTMSSSRHSARREFLVPCSPCPPRTTQTSAAYASFTQKSTPLLP
jgi:hypothetical protein